MLFLLAHFAFSAIVGVWTWRDSKRRQARKPLFGAALTVWMGPLFVGFYLADRPLVAPERRTGGFAWNMARGFAVAWTGYLAPWVLPVAVGVTTSRSPAVYASTLATVEAIWLLPVAAALVVGGVLRRPTVVDVGSQVPATGRVSLTVAFLVASLCAWAVVGIAILA